MRTLRIATLLALAVLSAAVGPVRAELATEIEMRRVAENWLAYIVHERGSWAGDVSPEIVQELDLRDGGTLLGRVYAVHPRGFVVVPVLKEIAPVKAYAENCDFPDGPEGVPALVKEDLQSLLGAFVEKGASLDSSPSPRRRGTEAEAREAWARFAGPRAQLGPDLLETPRLVGVGPLLSSHWVQSGPYNLFCPIGYQGQRTGVGCVALAEAQLIRYHEWPPTGVGTSDFQWGGDVSCDDSVWGGGYLHVSHEDPYDWENMPDQCMFNACTQVQKEAAAELCYEVGVSLPTYYGACGSGSTIERCPPSLETHFRYEPGIEQVLRASYTAESWFQIIKAEINALRPMLYEVPFHAVVCDGWREAAGLRQYHMNYGWGSPADIWYTLDDLQGHVAGDNLLRWIMPEGRIVHLRPDGTGDYPTIQAAIDAVATGYLIRLENGVYSGPGNRDLQLAAKTVTISSSGGDPDLCVIDCGHAARAVTADAGPTQSLILKGLTLRNGSATGEVPDDRGGAVYCSGSSLVMASCKVSGCHADGDGGAVCCDSSDFNAEDCLFLDNASGGSGGAIRSCGAAEAFVTRCTLAGNSAEIRGGGVSADRLPYFEDCAVHGNWTAGNGGGLCLSPEAGLESWIWRSTVSGNRAQQTGGGIHVCGAGSLYVERTILWANAAGVAGDDLGTEAAPWVRFGCSDCDSSRFDGTGSVVLAWHNLDADPGFCDPHDAADAPTLEGDYHLKDVSPCAQTTCGTVGALDVACAAGVHTVRADGAGEFATIQEAVDGIPWYDIAELASGLYGGPGNRDIDFHGKAMTLRGMDAGSSVIDCQELGRAFHFHSGEGHASRVENLTVMNGRADTGGAVLCEDSSPTLRGCLFHHNSAAGAGGALACSSASPAVESCTFAENSAASGAGIRCGPLSCPAFESVIVAFSAAGEAVSCDTASAAVLTCSNLFGNAGGDWVGTIADQESLNGNFSADPLFCDPEDFDYAFDSGSPCANRPGCGEVGALGVGCYQYRSWHVPGEVATIATALELASRGDTIVVACGTYAEHNLVMKPGVIVLSETRCADCATIDGEQQGRIFCCNGVDSTTAIRGLTLTGGVANGTYWPANAGAGIYCENASPRIQDCILDGNSAVYGGGVGCNLASPRITGCTLVRNRASGDGGGVYGFRSSVAIENSVIGFNEDGGSVVCGYQTEADLACCDVYGNLGGDWTGCLTGKDGVDGNFSADPLFCEPFTGWVALLSPCAAENSPPGCGQVGALGVGCIYAEVAGSSPGIPAVLTLGPPVPNPFNPVTEVSYGIPSGSGPSRVVISVYDVAGRRVTTLVDGYPAPGTYRVAWDGTDHRGTPVASGIYFYRITRDGESLTRRMVLLK